MLIGLHGRKQAGKDTLYERAALQRPNVERASFADLLYMSAAAALGISNDSLRELKSNPRALVQVRVKHESEALGFWAPESSITVREYLQLYGTEAHRDLFGPDFWVERVNLAHAGRVLFVTDVRFENEARAVRAAGGAIVHVIGPDEVEHAGDGHASEAQLPAELIDASLHNDIRDDGFRSLDRKVDTLLRLHLGGDLPC